MSTEKENSVNLKEDKFKQEDPRVKRGEKVLVKAAGHGRNT
jgi:hypothetical protein